jgi:hypothetical protein
LPIPVFEDEFEQFQTQDEISQLLVNQSQPEEQAVTSQQYLSARPFSKDEKQKRP